MESRWRDPSAGRPSANPTKLLFHVSDAHGLVGYVPNFDQGETWDSVHDALHHRAGERVDHDHDA
jgi:hypothetical protein